MAERAMAMAGVLGLAILTCLKGIIAKDMTPSEAVSQFLVDHGLPAGLLPASVTNYELSDNGDFKVFLQHSCYAKFDNKVWYDNVISGNISPRKIENLSGIQAQELFLWVPVTGVHVDESNTRYIYFEVGVITKKLSIAQFEKPPVCKADGFTSVFEVMQKSFDVKNLY